MYATEQRRGISTAASYCRGQMVAVRYQSHWYRARVLDFKPATNFAWVDFLNIKKKQTIIFFCKIRFNLLIKVKYVN